MSAGQAALEQIQQKTQLRTLSGVSGTPCLWSGGYTALRPEERRCPTVPLGERATGAEGGGRPLGVQGTSGGGEQACDPKCLQGHPMRVPEYSCEPQTRELLIPLSSRSLEKLGCANSELKHN